MASNDLSNQATIDATSLSDDQLANMISKLESGEDITEADLRAELEASVDSEEVVGESVEEPVFDDSGQEAPDGKEEKEEEVSVDDDVEGHVDEGEVEVEESEREDVSGNETSEGKDDSDELTRLRRQVEEKEKMVQKFANEVGDYRKQNRELAELLKSAKSVSDSKKVLSEDERFEIADRLSKGDVSVLDDYIASVNDRASDSRRQKELEQRRQVEDYLLKNREMVDKLVPDLADLKSDMADIARAEGLYTVEEINQFLENPYLTEAKTVADYASRARLQKQIKSLQAEVNRLKGSPEKVLKKANKASKSSRSTISSKTGRSSKGGAKTSVESLLAMSPSEMTDDQLKQAIAEIEKKGF